MPRSNSFASPQTRCLEILGHRIGAGERVFVIAEAGVNHNGSPETAKDLIHTASTSGADCVKFQTFHSDQVASVDAPKASYQLSVTDPSESQLEMLEKLELQKASYADLMATCVDESIVFSSTPYNEDDIAFLDALDVPFFKAASMHCAEPYFLQNMAQTGRPIILSTGMADWEELDIAVSAIRQTGNDKLILLQCTTNYPSAVQDANLRTMEAMAKRYDCLVGYSDHTQSHTACLAAVAMGACVVERHLTLDKTMPGPDHSSSDSPEDFRTLVDLIREVEVALGSAVKQPTDTERQNISGMRRSIVARREMPVGHVISDRDLICKRPATGIKPSFWNEIVGRTATRNVSEGSQLTWEDVGE